MDKRIYIPILTEKRNRTGGAGRTSRIKTAAFYYSVLLKGRQEKQEANPNSIIRYKGKCEYIFDLMYSIQK